MNNIIYAYTHIRYFKRFYAVTKLPCNKYFYYFCIYNHKSRIYMHVYTKEEEDKMVLEAFDDLQRAYGASNHKHKFEIVAKAFEFAAKAHEGVKRRTGEPYILHPLAVAKICVEEMGLGSTSICAALMHDVVEDTDFTVEDIANMFGETIANIVDGLTKISGDIFHESVSKQAENFQKLILTIPSDVRVIMIKLADRLHNMRTLDSMPPLKQQKITGETIFIYVPLAERLGFFKIKTELENLCLKYQQPKLYHELEEKITKITPKLEEKIESFLVPIREKLDQRGIKYNIITRIKSPYSIYRKQEKKEVNFDEIYDLLAVRIIVEPQADKSEEELCWTVFGIVTSLYPEHPSRTRNWLSTPKANGYQALHVTVMRRGDKGEIGSWVEVQIRTERMNEIAERGLAAHWKYKNGIEDNSEFDEWFHSVRELLATENIDTVEFVDKFKMNLDTKEIVVFTPKGDIKRLPQDATVLDFAYALHTDIGNHCIGGKIDSRLVPISQRLKSGNQIEILTSKTQQPEAAWLDFAKTQNAISKIRSFLRPEVTELQKEGAEKVNRLLVFFGQKLVDDNIDKVKTFFNYDKRNDFFVDVARQKVDLTQVSKSLFQSPASSIFSFFTKNFNIMGGKKVPKLNINPKEVYYITKDDMAFDLVRLAPCCKPIKGDEIVGFLEDNHHVVVHKLDCDEAQRIKATHGNRIVLVDWQKDMDNSYLINLSIEGIDRQGLLRQIVNVISEKVQINIKNINFSTIDGAFYGNITLFAHSNDEIELLTKKLLKIKAVKSVKRVN